MWCHLLKMGNGDTGWWIIEDGYFGWIQIDGVF